MDIHKLLHLDIHELLYNLSKELYIHRPRHDIQMFHNLRIRCANSSTTPEECSRGEAFSN